MRLCFALLALLAVPTRAHADTMWQVAGGAVVGAPPGPAFTADLAAYVSDNVALGGHVALLLSIQSEHLRAMIGPVVAYRISKHTVGSFSVGFVDVFAKTLHSTSNDLAYGASASLRFGLTDSGGLALGFELNYTTPTEVYRDLYVDVGGAQFAVLLGGQGF